MRAGRSPTAPVIGTLQPGQDINWGALSVDGWDYVEIGPEFRVEGWMPEIPQKALTCAAFVG